MGAVGDHILVALDDGVDRLRPSRLGGLYFSVRVIIDSMGTDPGEPAAHCFRIGCFSTTCWPRNVIGLTSFTGLASMIDGTNPSPV